ncbi:hypothetical protein FNF27_01282 [Cafeteria roenbergensis]|nr:hypothetical protein FNF27_01282 [Cafeteria roenbergensis]
MAVAGIGCRDEQGQPVDWFAAIKRNNSFGYAYMGPKSSDFSQSSMLLSDPSAGSISLTLAQLYGNQSLSYLFYNDEPPSSSSPSSYAHAKGVVGMDDSLDGFWLVHSTPRWPSGPSEANGYPGMPDMELTYGQSFLCISVSGAAALETIGQALVLDKPSVYDGSVSKRVGNASPAMTDVINKKWSGLPNCDMTQLKSSGGAVFSVFAKSSQWADELYSKCVAPKLGAQRLVVESWIRGGACDPQCGANEVLDVGNVEIAGWGWRETQDHSKWAATSDGRTGCIGDINRMTSQAKRGGGTVCTEAGALGRSLAKAVVSLSDSCNA